MTYVYSILLSLLLTLIIELTVSCLFGINKREDILLILAANILTNPAVVTASFVLKRTIYASVYYWQIPFEAAVVIVECLLYRKFGKSIKRPLAYSAAANAISYSAGVLISFIF